MVVVFVVGWVVIELVFKLFLDVGRVFINCELDFDYDFDDDFYGFCGNNSFKVEVKEVVWDFKN